MKKQLKIYVAGPLSKGNVEWNVERGIAMSDRLVRAGFAPYVPHLTFYWNKFYPHSWTEWLDLDEQWLSVCDALIRLSGESRGADREENFAIDHNIPVFYSLKELKAWAKNK